MSLRTHRPLSLFLHTRNCAPDPAHPQARKPQPHTPHPRPHPRPRTGYFDTTGRSDGRYISYDRAWGRITSQLDSLSTMDNPSRRQLRGLYQAAHDIPGADLRAFNGFQFYRG